MVGLVALRERMRIMESGCHLTVDVGPMNIAGWPQPPRYHRNDSAAMQTDVVDST